MGADAATPTRVGGGTATLTAATESEAATGARPATLTAPPAPPTTLTAPAPAASPPWRPAASTPPRRPRRPASATPTATAGTPGTRPAPRISPRAEHNPPARRRAVAALLAAFGLLAAMIAAAFVLGSGSGSGSGKHRHVVPRIQVPNVTGLSTATAEARLEHSHLQAHVVTVPWPGHAAGTVRSQSPVARRVKRHSTVTLNVAEVPAWKTLGQFSSTSSPVYVIQGSRFRIVYSVQNERSCTLWVFCSRTSATVADTASGAPLDHFDLSDGDAQSQVFATGPGSYQIEVDPSSGDARWSFEVQDWY